MPQAPSKEQTFTFQTRLRLEEAKHHDILSAYAALFGTVERHLFATHSSGQDLCALKASTLKRFSITARQFNACRISLQGKIDSYLAGMDRRIAQLEDCIEALEKTIAKLALKTASQRLLHQKKRRLSILQTRLEQLSEDKKNKKARICFGSKRLFHAQFHLAQNGYTSHYAWKQEWQQARQHEFFVLGSKDETAGNQSCTATLENDQSLTLRLRLPDALQEQYGKYLILSNVKFNYGQHTIVQALQSNLERNRLQKTRDKSYLEFGRAISYRFHQDKKGWRIFVSLSVPAPSITTRSDIGRIGIDINADHLALAEIDRFGNPIHSQTFPLSTYGKSQSQAKALIEETCAEIISFARQRNKPIVLENLDFQQKKSSLREQHCHYSRMLSSFSYSAIRQSIQSGAFRQAVELFFVNPAFTSIIGRIKFAKRYGLSIHHAAAVVIARRSLGASERPPRHSGPSPDGKGNHVTFPLPVRNRGKHVWCLWRQVAKKLPVVHVAQTQTTRKRRSLSTVQTCLRDESSLGFVGAIPTHKSSIQRLD